MPKVYTVTPGDTLSSIAEQFGFARFETIWNDEANADLRALRPNPHVLLPGDQVTIPDRVERLESAEAGKRQRFLLHRPALWLRMALRDESDRPHANTPCVLEVAGESHELVTDAGGLLSVEIPRSSTQARLTVDDPELEFDIRVPMAIGHLDPVESPSGQRDRLRNLGYYLVEGDEEDEPALRSAVEEFQCDQGLPVTGDCDPATQERLQAQYGC